MPDGLRESTGSRGAEFLPGSRSTWTGSLWVEGSSRAGNPGFLRELREAVWAVNPTRPLASVQTVEEIRVVSMARTSFMMTMLGIAAAVAFLLEVVGSAAATGAGRSGRENEGGGLIEPVGDRSRPSADLDCRPGDQVNTSRQNSTQRFTSAIAFDPSGISYSSSISQLIG